jgi:hypothetical protein
MKYWEIIADKLSKAGFSWGCVATVDSDGRTIFVADAHRDDALAFVLVGWLRLNASSKRTSVSSKNAGSGNLPCNPVTQIGGGVEVVLVYGLLNKKPIQRRQSVHTFVELYLPISGSIERQKPCPILLSDHMKRQRAEGVLRRPVSHHNSASQTAEPSLRQRHRREQ